MNRLVVVAILAGLVSGTAFAQTQGATPGPPPAGKADLSVASVKMDDGIRVSKLIGAAVYGDTTTQLGTIDDLIMAPDHKVALAIVAVGGLMGVGARLVAVPIGRLEIGADGKVTLPGGSKDSLTAMPIFVYNG